MFINPLEFVSLIEIAKAVASSLIMPITFTFLEEPKKLDIQVRLS